jgi:hypothetical protein
MALGSWHLIATGLTPAIALDRDWAQHWLRNFWNLSEPVRACQWTWSLDCHGDHVPILINRWDWQRFGTHYVKAIYINDPINFCCGAGYRVIFLPLPSWVTSRLLTRRRRLPSGSFRSREARDHPCGVPWTRGLHKKPWRSQTGPKSPDWDHLAEGMQGKNLGRGPTSFGHRCTRGP